MTVLVKGKRHMFDDHDCRINLINSAHMGGINIGQYSRKPFPVRVDPVEKLDISHGQYQTFATVANIAFREAEAKKFAANLVRYGKLNHSDVELIAQGRGILKPRHHV